MLLAFLSSSTECCNVSRASRSSFLDCQVVSSDVMFIFVVEMHLSVLEVTSFVACCYE